MDVRQRVRSGDHCVNAPLRVAAKRHGVVGERPVFSRDAQRSVRRGAFRTYGPFEAAELAAELEGAWTNPRPHGILCREHNPAGPILQQLLILEQKGQYGEQGSGP